VRQILRQARKQTKRTQKETADAIAISGSMYRAIEYGTREGKGHIWDALEALFEYKIPQRQLRQNDSHPDYSKTTETAK
jgi:transcriptional regulator with XRE-family HTH domain